MESANTDGASLPFGNVPHGSRSPNSVDSNSVGLASVCLTSNSNSFDLPPVLVNLSSSFILDIWLMVDVSIAEQ